MGANNADFRGYDITHKQDNYGDLWTRAISRGSGEVIGSLQTAKYDSLHHQVLTMDVHPAYQGSGVMTALVKAAREKTGSYIVAPESVSADGERFTRKMVNNGLFQKHPEGTINGDTGEEVSY